jgi:hypothetical protein
VGNLVIKGTAKTFKYRAGIESIAEGNSVQLPFIAEYKGEKKTALEYTWYTKDDKGDIHKRGIFVSGHGTYGVPTLFEYDVYVTLQDIFLKKKTKNGICELKTNNIDDNYLKIEFSINELAREMGYKLPINNSVRNNLKKAIKTLLATTVFSIYEGGVYDVVNKKYITNKEIGFHYLESYESENTTTEDGRVIDVTRIKLSRFTYHQILNDYKLFYNKNGYIKIKNRIAKKIYHMALQWKGKNDFAWARLETIIEKIPMIENKKKYQNRKIRDALKILNKSQIVKISYGKDDPNLVYFNFSNKDDEKNIMNKYNTHKEVEEELYKIGFSLVETQEYFDIEDIRYLQALLRYLDVMKPINKKRYFKSCYEKRIDVSQYYNEDYCFG